MDKTVTPDASQAKQSLLARRRLVGSHYGMQDKPREIPPPDWDEEAEYMTRAVDYELSEEEREELVEIDRALDRIDRGRWGVCEACGQEIDSDRLVALPEARDCLRCAVRREHHPF